MTSLTVAGMIGGRKTRAASRMIMVVLSTLLFGLGAGERAGAQAPLHSWVFSPDSARSRKTGETSSVRSLADTLTKTLAKLEMHETTLAPGASPHAAHRHAHEEFLIIKTGTIAVLQDTVTRMAGPGSVVFMASNEWHGIRNIGSGTASYLVVRFDPHDLPPDSASVGRAPVPVPSAPTSGKR